MHPGHELRSHRTSDLELLQARSEFLQRDDFTVAPPLIWWRGSAPFSKDSQPSFRAIVFPIEEKARIVATVHLLCRKGTPIMALYE